MSGTELDDPAPEGSGTLDQLVQGLADGAEPVDEGEFTLDERQAREKLAEYRLREPELWVTLVAQAAGWYGATLVTYESGNDSTMRVPGLQLEPTDLELLFARGLMDLSGLEGTARAVAGVQKCLAIAVEAALATDASVVTIEVRSDRLRRLRIEPDSTSLEDAELPAGAQPGLTFRVERRGRSEARSRREVALLDRLTRFAPYRVEIDGNAVRRILYADMEHGVRSGTVKFSVPELRLAGFCSRSYRLEAAHYGLIHYVLRGVVVGTRPLGSNRYGAVAFADFATDLSGSALREDELFEAATREARRARDLLWQGDTPPPARGSVGSGELPWSWASRIAFGATVALVLALLVLWLGPRRTPGGTALGQCEAAPLRCLTIGDRYRECARRGGWPLGCEKEERRRGHWRYAYESYRSGCRSGNAEACHRIIALMDEVPVDYDYSREDAVFYARVRLCRGGSVGDCRAAAEMAPVGEYGWEDRSEHLVVLAHQICVLEKDVECRELHNLGTDIRIELENRLAAPVDRPGRSTRGIESLHEGLARYEKLTSE